MSIEYLSMETLLPRQSEASLGNPYQPPLTPPALQPKLRWSAPTWSNSRELGRVAWAVFSKGVLFRIAFLMGVVTAIICIVAKIAVPGLQFDFLWRALLAYGMLFTIIVAMGFVACVIPDRISIYEDGVVRYSKFVIRPVDVESLQINVLSTDRIQLVIRERGRLHKIAVSPGTDIGQLAALLGSAQVADMQRHFRLARQWMGILRKPRKALMQNKLVESDAV